MGSWWKLRKRGVLQCHQLHACDVLVGHVEVPHTARGIETHFDVPPPASDPAHLAALQRAGFDVATLAGNHIADAGPNGVEDTIAELRRLGIATTGAGMNLTEARQPAIVQRKGLRFGFLSYNCVGPRESWAGRDRAGCAYVHVLTHYELDHASPEGPPTVTATRLSRILRSAVKRLTGRSWTSPDTCPIGC